jgi:hypothetical protein
VCKRYAREKLRADGDVDAWLDSLLEISEIVRREMKLGKRTGTTRERMARWSQSRPAVTDAVENPNATATAETAVQRPASSNVSATAPAAPPEPPPSIPGTSVMPVLRKRFTPVFEQREIWVSPDGIPAREGDTNE